MNKLDLIKLLLSDSLSENKNDTTPVFEVGKKYFFRTVTYFTVGKIAEIKNNFIIFKPNESAWIADTGRLGSTFLQEGKPSELEPINTTWFVNMDSIVDGGEWLFDIPTEQK